MMILFYLIFLFCKINGPDSILYIFYPPRILFGIDIFLSFYVLSLALSLDRIHFYVIPIIGLVFILKDITGRLGILFS